MRRINGEMLSAIQTQQGLEPIIWAGITWGGATYLFCSKSDYAGRPSILTVGNCSYDKRHDSASTTGSTTLTLDDSDGFLKSVIDVLLTEKAPARIYMAVDQMPFSMSVLLINGRIGGPVTYSEGDRILTLTVETEIETEEAGFAPTDEFEDLSPEAIGVPWPMVFGKVAHIPCVHVRKKPEGTLKTPIRLWSEIFKPIAGPPKTIIISEDCHVDSYFGAAKTRDILYIRDGNLFPQNQTLTIAIEGVRFRGKFNGEIFTVEAANTPAFENITFAARSAEVPDSEWFAKLPAGVNLSGHYIYLGTNPGKLWFNYIVKQEGQICEFRFIAWNPVSKIYEKIGSSRTIVKAYPIMKNGLVGEAATYLEDLIIQLQSSWVDSGKDRSGMIKSLIEGIENSTEIFWQAPADSIVRLVDQENPDIYVVSCVPLESVDAVYGYKDYQFSDGKTRKVLAPIPQEYYTIQLQSNYPVNGALASALLFHTPLRDYKDEGWDDRVLATATSTIGPNVSNILYWILSTYAPQLNPIESTFERLDDDLDPANFAYTQTKNALELATEIAWQARCALRIDGENVELILVDEHPNSILTVTESNTLRDSVTLGFTPTSQIRTKFVCRWSVTHRDRPRPGVYNEIANQRLIDIINSLLENESKADERVTVYRENVDTYGEKIEDVNIYIFNDEEFIQRTLAFWGHRRANSWRTVQLTTFLNAIHLQQFDKVTLAYSNTALATLNSMPAIVESMSIDLSTKLTTLNLWLPSLAGYLDIDEGAWST